MAHVLVTGGTGVLGSRLVPELIGRGHRVRTLSRHGGPGAEGVEASTGNVRTGEGVAAAAKGVDAVVHAATNAAWRARSTEVDGVRHVVDAIAGSEIHVIYVSIVGVDRHRFPYYKAKWAAEQLVESSPVRWTVQRATQFHDLLERFLSLRVFPVTRDLAFQVVDTGEVAVRLADLVESGETGRVDDFGGPEVVPIRELAKVRRRVTGRRARLVPAPRVGFLRDFDEGRHHAPDHRSGTITWEEWLRSQLSVT